MYEKCYNCPWEIACCPRRFTDLPCSSCMIWECIDCEGCYRADICTIKKGVD